jgi:poly-gamma-glutamate synthase PgsB/CapB
MFSEYSINGYWFVLFLTLLVIIHLAIEIIFHNRRLSKIKFRIHVNGTRGKSSVARLIAAGLRGGGVKTVCKTTGTMARFISPTAEEESIIRLGRTNVIEQVKVVKKASSFKPDALVIECMAVQPLLQSLCELKLVQSNIGVLCNAKADHLDVMGPTEKDVAYALSATMPIKGHFFTPEKKFISVFESAAKDRQSMVIKVEDPDINAVTRAEMEKFSYVEYEENVALALKVCTHCGVKREDALEGMWLAKPDPGALIVKTINYKGKKVTFANGFAANDPDSTKLLWDKLIEMHPDVKEVIALVNCRADRGDRSRQMAESISTWQQTNHIISIGSGCDIFLKSLDKKKVGILKNAQGYDVFGILDYITTQSEEKHILVIGICNIAQIGFLLLNYFLEQEGVQ